MSNRILLYMTLAVVAGFAIIILMNVITLFGFSQAKYISPGDVRGMAVEHKKKLYTLSFEQQNACIDIFNRSIPISHAEAESRIKAVPEVPDIQKIIIYRFNAPDIEIQPIAYVTKTYSQDGRNPAEHLNLVFSAPIWNPSGLMEEATQDQIQEILFKTYDP